ncbi:uncharacterized protein LOC100871180 isoform X1 [Apis florea]|uniref:uncharacterized protein LOC100871180 isoform X1 n=1 Tax=Apis florea TaxID=7463 RepID=UPI00062909CD|nr:uncharacterized protein LOC100871180 isoform X1 [Apis florea]
MLTGWLTSFRTTHNLNIRYNVCSYLLTQTRDYAARKGTREKRLLAKKKRAKKQVTVEQVGYVPYKQHKKQKIKEVCPLNTIDDSWKWKAIDNVWIVKYHQRPIYSLQEAIECHRETHHPTMYNKPNAIVNAFVELDMRREKKNRFVDKFTRIVDTPHIFENSGNKRTVLAFSKNLEEQEKARDAGADYSGGTELIKKIQNGTFQFKDYDFVVAHANILSDLLLIRGLLKKKFPNIRIGNLGTDMNKLVTKFKNGIGYTAIPHKTFKEYGEINVAFGLLDMDMKYLEANFHALINDIEVMRPRDASFIVRIQIRSELSDESFTINYQDYVATKTDKETNKEEIDETAIIDTQ